MALRFQTRLSLAMSFLIGMAICAMAILVLWAATRMILEHYHSMGVTLTKLATRNIQYGVSLPDRVTDRVGEQMVVSGLLVAELVAIAEGDAGKSPDEISALLRDVRDRSKEVRGYPLVDDIWVTDETGREYIGASKVSGFTFSPDPTKNPQSYEFYSLLSPGTPPIIQRFQPRDEDGEYYEYVGVSGVDKPRIIQIGAGERLIKGIKEEFSVQNVVDRFFEDLNATRMMVIDADGKVLAAAGLDTLPPEQLKDPVVCKFAQNFLANPGSTFSVKPFGEEMGVVTRLQGVDGQTPSALFIQHRTEEGFHLIRESFRYVIGLSIVTIGAAIILIMVLSNGFSRPLRALAAGARQFGKGNLDYRVRLDTRDEMESLAVAFNSMADSLQNRMRELERETKRRERLESELAIAAEMQRGLLPESAPRIEGLELTGWSQPAREVGGDFYDFLDMGPGRIGVAIGDATGKGLTAAMLTSECWSVFRALATELQSPAELLARTNRALCNNVGMSGRFVTLFFMIVDTDEGTITYAQGGHNPPILAGVDPKRRIRLSSSKGLPLGIERDCGFEDRVVALEPNDTIVLYSDGVTEARTRDDRLYGEPRFQDIVDRLVMGSIEDIIDGLRRDVESYLSGQDLTDDITMVAVRFKGTLSAVDPSA